MYFFLKNVIPKNIIIHLINTGSVFSSLSKNKKKLGDKCCCEGLFKDDIVFCDPTST